MWHVSSARDRIQSGKTPIFGRSIHSNVNDRRRELVRDLEAQYGVSERRSCGVLLFFRSSH
ncbi:MAG: hypothetical protein ACRD4Q_07620, partial [Candidatus Acidiferrales bacterium]